MCCDEGWEDEEVLAVLQMVYETTPRTDRGLRNEILEVYSRYSDTLMDNTRLISMLDDDGLLARDILKTTKEALSKKAAYFTRRLEESTTKLRSREDAHKKEMQIKDEAHRQAIQSRDAACQQASQALQSKDREHQSVVEEHMRTVQSMEEKHRRTIESKEDEFREAFKKTIQAKDETLKNAQGWAREEVRVLRELISKHAVCRRCAQPLELKLEPGCFGYSQTRTNLECRHCNKLKVETRGE
ncbi:MAG: hypothetical protein Q9212_007015 [Teloschistes hypoglaucus]